MKSALWEIIGIAILLWYAKTQVSFKPFKVTMENGYGAIAVVFIVLAMLCVRMQGYNDGVNDLKDAIIRKINEKKI